MTSHRCDVVIVGGGAMGLATAWWLAPRRDVVLLERFEQGHRRGASHGDERIFRYLYSDRAYVELALAADEGWQRLERDADRRLLHRVGSIQHGDVDQLAEMAAAAEACGVAIEWLRAEQATRRWPALRFDGDVLLQPHAGWAHASEALRSLATLATAAGADLRFDAPVSSLELADGSDGVRVRCGHDVYRADSVVITAGAWTATLLQVALPPLVTTEEHVFFFRPRTGADTGVPSFIHVDDRARYGLEGPGGLVKLGEHHTGTITTGDDRTFAVDPERTARMERYVAEWLPGLSPEAVSTTTCLYTSTPSHDFVLDRVGPIVIGTGFSGHGFKFLPEIGRRLAALATDDADPDPRFSIEAHRGGKEARRPT